MGHNNYSKFSRHNNQEEQHHIMDVPSFEEKNEEIEVNEMPVHTHPVNEVVETVTQAIVGKVSECSQLYVRKEGKKESDVLCTIDKDSEVQINKVESTEEFYKVITPSGIEGYCMKKFIEIK